MIKEYMEVSIELNRKDSDQVLDRLSLIDSLGIEVIDSKVLLDYSKKVKDDEIFDLDIDFSDKIIVKLYFNEDENFKDNISKLEKLKDEFELKIIIGRVKNDWNREWLKHYKAIEVSEDLTVIPYWLKDDLKGQDKTTIKINPGMAFGTGSHETTKLVLREIDKYDLKGKTCLDIGCGSGILSILMSLKGASRIDAIDISEDSIDQTKMNMKLNGISNIDVRISDLFSNVGGTYSFICANLLAEIIVNLMDDVDEYLDLGGLLILSGIIDSREDIVLNKIKENGNYTIINREKENDWIMLTLERSN